MALPKKNSVFGQFSSLPPCPTFLKNANCLSVVRIGVWCRFWNRLGTLKTAERRRKSWQKGTFICCAKLQRVPNGVFQTVFFRFGQRTEQVKTGQVNPDRPLVGLPWTSSWDVSWGVLEGLKTGKSALVGALVAGLVGPLVGHSWTHSWSHSWAHSWVEVRFRLFCASSKIPGLCLRQGIPLERDQNMLENTTLLEPFGAFCSCGSWPPSDHTTLKIGRTPSGSCNNTLLRGVLRGFFRGSAFLEGFLEGGGCYRRRLEGA